MRSTILSSRDLEFLLFEWLDVERLSERPRFAEHDRASWIEQLVAVGEREGDFYDGKRAAARYFLGWELPKVTPMLDLLASGDTTTLEMRAAWF